MRVIISISILFLTFVVPVSAEGVSIEMKSEQRTKSVEGNRAITSKTQPGENTITDEGAGNKQNDTAIIVTAPATRVTYPPRNPERKLTEMPVRPAAQHSESSKTATYFITTISPARTITPPITPIATPTASITPKVENNNTKNDGGIIDVLASFGIAIVDFVSSIF